MTAKTQLRRRHALWIAVASVSGIGGVGGNASRGAYYSTDTVDYTNPSTFNYQVSTGIMGTQQVGYGQTTSAPYNDGAAFLWNASSSQTYVLEPATGYTRSNADATNGLHQVGELVTTGGQGHAFISTWVPTPGTTTYVDLHPTGYTFSEALAISGSQQAGDVQPSPGVSHAAIWSGTAASFQDLNTMPTITFASSTARGTTGSAQAGDGVIGTVTHAVLWHGALSVTDLHPSSGYVTTSAEGISGNEEVGLGNVSGNQNHALLWHGTAASLVDLHPTGYNTSGAQATNGLNQVGFGQQTIGGSVHALFWSGTAASKVDLHSLIPGAPTDSYANAIDPYGNISGYAFFGAARHAIVWYNGDTYTGFSNAWNSLGNWESLTPPVAGHDVLLIPTVPNTPTLDFANGVTPTYGKLVVDNAGGGNMQLNIGAGATLNTTSDVIGWVGKGSINQTGGTHVSTGLVELGHLAGSLGTYTIGASSGVATLTAEAISVGGDSGSASFTQSAGSAVSTPMGGSIVVGSGVGASGLYQQSGGTTSVFALDVGDHGVGTYDMTGGTVTADGQIMMGGAAGGDGTLNVRTGAAATSQTMSVGNASSVGSLHVLGGTVTVTDGVTLHGTGISVIELNGGRLTVGSLDTLTNPARVNWSAGTLEFTEQSPDIGTLSQFAVNLDLIAAKTLRIKGSSQCVRIDPAGSVAFNGGKIDLTDKKLISSSAANPVGSWNGTAYTGLTGAIAAGRNGGALPLWDGAGIVTSQSTAMAGNLNSIGIAKGVEVKSQTSSTTALWGGQTVTGTDTLVMYTYGGDANLDGKINIDDYVRIDTGIASGLTGWSNGDFNYDGKVNIDDYTTVIDANIGNQTGVFPTTGGMTDGAVAVPEPSILTLMLALTWPLRGRRMRRTPV